MIRVNIYARFKERKALSAVKTLPQMLSEILSHENCKIEPGQVSVRSILISANGSMVADNEVEILVNNDEYLVKNQEAICKRVADFLNEKHGMNNCCVWILSGNLGFYRN